MKLLNLGTLDRIVEVIKYIVTDFNIFRAPRVRRILVDLKFVRALTEGIIKSHVTLLSLILSLEGSKNYQEIAALIGEYWIQFLHYDNVTCSMSLAVIFEEKDLKRIAVF